MGSGHGRPTDKKLSREGAGGGRSFASRDKRWRWTPSRLGIQSLRDHLYTYLIDSVKLSASTARDGRAPKPRRTFELASAHGQCRLRQAIGLSASARRAIFAQPSPTDAALPGARSRPEAPARSKVESALPGWLLRANPPQLHQRQGFVLDVVEIDNPFHHPVLIPFRIHDLVQHGPPARTIITQDRILHVPGPG